MNGACASASGARARAEAQAFGHLVLNIDDAELAECVLLDTKFEAKVEHDMAEEEQQPAADPEQAVTLESCRLAHDQRNAARTYRGGWEVPHGD
jgi:hypothetical protein